MKKIFVFLMATLLCNAFAYGQTNLQKVDIIQIVAHPALDITRKGMIDQLALDGFIDGKNISIKFANAQGDLVLSNQIARKFASEEPDCIVAIGTTAAQSVARTNKKVVFSSVTDPLGVKLVNNLVTPEANVTGVSNFVRLDEQMQLFKSILPKMRRLGFIYNPGDEANSGKILQELKIQAAKQDIEIISAVASKATEVSVATDKLIGKVDAIFISNDNNALSAFAIITKTAFAARIPVFVSDTDLVENGALASLGPNQYEIGKQTGKMVSAILHGKPIKDLPVEFPLKKELVLNQKLAQELGIIFPEELLLKAKK